MGGGERLFAFCVLFFLFLSLRLVAVLFPTTRLSRRKRRPTVRGGESEHLFFSQARKFLGGIFVRVNKH